MSHSLKYFLTSDRLGFRHWTVADLPIALALWTDPQVMRLLGGPLEKQKVGERLAREMAL